ncbi:MAG: YihY/virulence factor BrkB family protein [Syntrophorhabdaceae bacterium]|nr:YihY/virulence factor BrkB family protein [Syntrophorhabdaceae bacterium]
MERIIYVKIVRVARFFIGVLKRFKENQGLLLSGAVAFYTLLSIIPMLVISLIVLSRFFEEGPLFNTLSTYVEMMIPGYTKILKEQVGLFFKHRTFVGIIGFLFMLFFSSLAFSVLESAMATIFSHRKKTSKRHFIISAIIPYFYMLFLGVVISIVSFIAGVLELLNGEELNFLAFKLSLRHNPRIILYILAILSEALMITSFYLILPPSRTRFSHAIIGGVVATILWEVVRRALLWYYSTLSLVNLVYGSFAAAILALLNIEAAAMILLLGAQVIAELELRG